MGSQPFVGWLLRRATGAAQHGSRARPIHMEHRSGGASRMGWKVDERGPSRSAHPACASQHLEAGRTGLVARWLTTLY